MKKKLFILILVFCTTFILSAQEKAVPKIFYKNQLIFTVGLPYSDGLISINKNPTLGIAYERRINRWFSLAAHVMSSYQNDADFYVVSNNPDFPVIDKYRGSASPFLTAGEVKKLSTSGIMQLDPSYNLKYWSVPMDIGVTLYPLSTKHHRIGVNTGLALTYETHTFWKDFASGTFTLPNGTEQNVLMSVPVEFRNISPGFTFKLHYQYLFQQSSFGVRIANYNVELSSVFNPNGGANEALWDTSIFYAYQF